VRRDCKGEVSEGSREAGRNKNTPDAKSSPNLPLPNPMKASTGAADSGSFPAERNRSGMKLSGATAQYRAEKKLTRNR
jgi:hypothetical protein